MVRWYLNILLGIDDFANSVLGGSPEESISSRTGRAYLSGKAKWFVYPLRHFVDGAAFILAKQRNHCVSSVEEVPIQPYEVWSWIKGK